MKIVHIFHSYWPAIGGMENVVKALAESMAELGHEVHVITSMNEAEGRAREEIINGVYIHRVKAVRLYDLDFMIPLEYPTKLLKESDIIQCYSQNSLFTYLMCRKAKKLGKRVSFYFLGVDYLRYHYNPLVRLVGYPYQKWITERVVKLTDLALVTNEYDRDLLEKRHGTKAVVLPHGIEKIYLEVPNIGKYLKEKYHIEGKIIAYISRIHSTKGLDIAIKAFGEVVKEVPNSILIVSGKIDDEVYLMKCLRLAKKLGIANKVIYLGYISEKDKIALIDASEVVVLPTKHAGENYLLLMDEVLARGKPMVIATISPALFQRAKKFGVAVTSNYSTLPSLIVKYLKDNVVYIPRQIKLYSWDEITSKILSLWHERGF
jgi:glycosyltransferase involved in cell wall biosynthesis